MMLARFAFMTRAYRARVGPLVTRSMTPIRSLRTLARGSGSWETARGHLYGSHFSTVFTDGRIGRSDLRREGLLTLLHSMRNGESILGPQGSSAGQKSVTSGQSSSGVARWNSRLSR